MVQFLVERAKSVVNAVTVPAILVVASIGLSGCFGSFNDVPGVPLSELDMGASAPTEIALSGPDNVILTVGDKLNVTVEGGTETENLRFDLSDDKLRIGREGDGMKGSQPATIRVTMPAPREISLAGSGSIDAPSLASSSEIDIAGSGTVTIAQIKSERLEVSMAGSGDFKAAGQTDRLEVSIAGSGDIDLAALTAENAEISIAGSGDITLASDGVVTATIAGSGDIKVTGNAKCTLKSVGSGTINCAPAEAGANTASQSGAASGEAVAD